MQPQQLETLADDTPCRPCGYNLRGLSPWGKCPECGGDVQDTLRAMRDEARKRPDISKVDPKSLSDWIEGLCCLIISFVMSAAAWFDVPLATRHSNNRVILLGVVVAAWVVGLLGAWKIGRPPGAYILGQPNIPSGRTLRVALVAYLLLPFIWGAMTNWLSDSPAMYFILPSVLAGYITGPALYFRLAKIAQMLPAKALRAFLFFPMIAAPVIFCGIFAAATGMGLGDDQSSLSLMLMLPSPAYSTTGWIRALVNFPEPPWFYLLFIPVALEPVLLLVLLIKLVRVRPGRAGNILTDGSR